MSPASISLGSGSTLYTAGAETLPLSITLPPSSSTSKVDIALLLDDTGSFASFAGTVQGIFSDLVTSLKAALPDVDLGFGVSRFEDYGGPFRSISHESASGRPFILDQPIVTEAAATAAGTDLLNLIKNALAATAPGGGGDGPETDLEGLYQLATGVGLDGNGNGSMLDSGPAGALGTTAITPGSSGDVPPFSSHVGVASGTLGGIGWRPDAAHIVLLATDTQPVASFSGSTIPESITGVGGASVPSTAFESAAGRVGYDSTAVDGAGTGPLPAVAPKGGATVQETVDALNKLGIRVIGMGPGAAPTSNTSAGYAPDSFFSAIARLTGAVDAKSGDPLVFSTSVSGGDLTSAIVNSVKVVATQPISIRVSPDSLPTGLGFTSAPSLIAKVGPAGTATFDVTLSLPKTSAAYKASFNAVFTDDSSGAILGMVPVQIDLPDAPTIPSEPGLPIGPPVVVSGLRTGIHRNPTAISVTFSQAMDAASVQDLHNYVLTGPAGTTVALASASYDPSTHTVTLRPKRRVNFHVAYTLTINGVGPDAVCSDAGVFLDGTADGKSGSNYVGRLRYYWLEPATTGTDKARSTAWKPGLPTLMSSRSRFLSRAGKLRSTSVVAPHGPRRA